MSFAVYLKECKGLRGRFDRIAKLSFREKTQTSIVYEFCSDPLWEQEFDWDLKGKPIKPSDSIEIQIMNYSTLFRHRLIGRFHMYLKKLMEEPYLAITDFIVDGNSTVLDVKVTFELLVSEEFPRELSFSEFHPVEEEERIYDDWELESVRTSRGGSRLTIKKVKSTLGSIFSTGGDKMDALVEGGLIIGGEEEGGGAPQADAPPKGKGKRDMPKVKDKFNLHPKVRVDLKPQREAIDFNCQLRIIEAVQLAGTQLDPVCDITCFGQTKSTQIKDQTNAPYFDEFFVFDTSGQRDLIFDDIIKFEIYSGRNYHGLIKGTLVGSYKIDVGTIYYNTDHRFLGKYGCLTNPDEIAGASGAGIKGYLKIDITILASGDPIKEPPNVKENTDFEANPLLPEGVKPERFRTRICLRILKAEGLPKMNSAILAKIRKNFAGEPRIRDLCDPFVKVEWAGMEASTSVKRHSYDPEWNQELVFCDMFPTLCRRIKISLMDKDARGDDTVSTFWIDLSEISNDGCNVHKFNLNTGFMPTFGPAWVNLYGSNRDYLFLDQNNFLNKGLEEGIGYRGRLLLQVHNEEGESAHDEEISNVEVKGTAPVSNLVGGKEDTFQLFCCIFEATLIDRKTAKKPIRFEMNIGNYGNTIDGKLVSWKEDDDEDEDEEDKFVQPLTPPVDAVTLDREYYNMPYDDVKPCVSIRFLLEDQRRRLYIQNILHKLVENLEDGMEDVTDKLAIDADDTYEFLQDALKGFIDYSKKVETQLAGKITGPKAGRTKLDKDRLDLITSEVKVVREEAEELLSGLSDNSRINSNYNRTMKLRDRIKKLMKEPQESTPDIMIWLISGNKRHSYVRIPAHKVIYSTVAHECGRDSGQAQPYFLTLPGKSGLGEKGWQIQCKLQCLVWLGLLKNKRDMLKHMPLGYEKPSDMLKATAPPPKEIVYTEKHVYQLRSHMYQARGLIGSDDSGLSDAFARVLFMNQAADTKIIWETRSPTWSQSMMFNDIVIWGECEFIKINPPLIVIEIFDFDEGGDIEFIGRAMARPLVKLCEDPYEKPLFPPKLEWFDIFRGEDPAGDVLAAFELFQLPDNDEVECYIPPPPIEVEDLETGEITLAVPDNIVPVMALHRIECLFWGVREMKKINFQSVERPRVEIDCVHENVKSVMIESAKDNPNFLEPYAFFDLELPEEDRYCPPLMISVKDKRMFGKEILCGTAIIGSLLSYLLNSEDYMNEDFGGSQPAEDEDGGAKIEEITEGENAGEVNEGFEGEEVSGSKKGSKAGSKQGSKVGSQQGSKVGSKVGSKQGSKVGSKQGSKVGSRAGSVAAPSRTGSVAAPSRAGSIAALSRAGSRPPSILSNRNGSIAPSRVSAAKSVSFAGSKQPSQTGSQRRESTRSRPASVVSHAASQSSKIQHHIRSNPGTPVSKLNTPRRTPSRRGSRRSVRGSTENIEMKEGIASPRRQSLAQSIRSVGSKLATPIQSLAGGSQAPRSKTGSRKSGSYKSLRAELNETDELELGAEAADYFPEEGAEGTPEEDLPLEGEEGELEGAGDGGAEGEGEGEEGGEGGDVQADGAEGAAGPPDPPAAPAEEGEGNEDDEEGGGGGGKIITVGEDELKAELSALKEEAEDEGSEEEEEKPEKPEGEGEGEEEESGDQIDWWSRFYEAIKDEQRAAEEREKAKKKKKKPEKTEDEEEEEEAPVKVTKVINPRIIRLKIYKTELEEVPAFDGFTDVLHSFSLLRGKSTGKDEDDEGRISGKFKGMFKVWKYPLPPLFDNPNLTMGSFRRLPTQETLLVLCRVYIVKAIELHPTDMDGKADPYIKIKVGKQSVSDRKNFVPKQLNPEFGRSFDFEITIPHDNLLTISIYDYDLVGKDELIGETKIDIENRFFTKHRATCGLSLRFHVDGYNKWRDPIKPSSILQHLCKDHRLDGPHFQPGKCRVNKWIFCGHETITDDQGNEKQSDEPSALVALHNFNMIEGKGYPLVPEHVETRSLLNPNQPGIEQGRVQMWIDLFGVGGPSPGEPIDITPRKPSPFELRCTIWNTEDVILGDINILTGNPCADIYVKGWIDGIKNNKQQTDVHVSSLTGEGNFNWRFIFPFKFHKAEEKVVITKKPTLFCWVATEEKVPARLILQCWDSDALSTDDFLGDCMLSLVEMPAPSKSAVQCTMETMTSDKKMNLFKKKFIKGWWPFICNSEDSEPELVGKVEAEIKLLTEVEAKEDPAGLGRKEPQPLDFPNRPDVGFKGVAGPLSALKNFLWAQYKVCLGKFAILATVFAVMGLFLYKAPDHVTKSLFG